MLPFSLTSFKYFKYHRSSPRTCQYHDLQNIDQNTQRWTQKNTHHTRRLHRNLSKHFRSSSPATTLPRSKLPSSDDTVPVVDLPLDPVQAAQKIAEADLLKRQRRVVQLRLHAQQEVSRIVNFGRHLRNYGKGWKWRKKRWRRLW